MADQGHNHHTRPHIQGGDMVAVHIQPRDQHHAGVGLGEETVAHAGGLQHHVDMAQPHGTGTAHHTLTAWHPCTVNSVLFSADAIK